MSRELFEKATAEERQDVVNQAHFLLELDACRQYGLIIGGPDINSDRCLEILAIGEEYGVTPSRDTGGNNGN